ncbi:MAG TPA: hypothetical protein VFR56_05160 [Actinomycetes bacterium]|nr:hypothetical protein [Actinomycetes bacterium]
MPESTPSRRFPTELRPLADEQDQVVTRAQLAELGIGHEGVRTRDAQGTWMAIGPRVVVLHTGELTRRQRAWVGVLHAGQGSALAMSTAAEHGGLRGYLEWDVHVAVAHGQEVGSLRHPLVTVRVHQTRHPAEDLVTTRTPPRHTMARAVVELAAVAGAADRCRAVLSAAVQQRLVRPEALADFVLRRPTLPRRQLIRETLAEVGGGAHSLPELDYGRVLRRAGLPSPTRQRIVQRADGRYYLDNDFEQWLVTVEINGSQHDDLIAREADGVRRQSLQETGRLVVDISAYCVRHEPEVAVLRTARALLSRGWQPSPRTVEMLSGYAGRAGWRLDGLAA